MPDHVPTQTGRALADFDPGFLHAIFAEQIQPQIGGRSHHRWWLAFGDREQGHGTRVTSGTSAGIRDSLLNDVQICG